MFMLCSGSGSLHTLECGLDLGIADQFQLGTKGVELVRGRKAPRPIPTMSSQSLVDLLLQEKQTRRGQSLLFDQEPTKWFGSLLGPGAHCSDQAVARHDVRLHCQDAEEQVAVG